MTPDRYGRPMLHGFVDSWECDFNAHWAIRFYGREFQMAAEKVASVGGEGNPGLAVIQQRYGRYHREVRAGQSYEIRSARIGAGAYVGAVAHLMLSAGDCVACALDLPGTGGAGLPELPEDLWPLVLPRDPDPAPAPWNSTLPGATVVEAGTLLPAHYDHTGHPTYETLLHRAGFGVHWIMGQIGWTQDFIDETGITRMGVQNALTVCGKSTPGTLVTVRSALKLQGRRSFSMHHWVETDAGVPLAYVSDLLVAVDMKTRRATALPAFMQEIEQRGSSAFETEDIPC